jgi:hypothetical protein
MSLVHVLAKMISSLIHMPVALCTGSITCKNCLIILTFRSVFVRETLSAWSQSHVEPLSTRWIEFNHCFHNSPINTNNHSNFAMYKKTVWGNYNQGDSDKCQWLELPFTISVWAGCGKVQNWYEFDLRLMYLFTVFVYCICLLYFIHFCCCCSLALNARFESAGREWERYLERI